MTIAQIGILAVLALVVCIVLSILGSMIMSSAASPQPTTQTYTLAPSPTAISTSTPWPTITPVPDWKVHSFASDQAQIWLPNSYFGGDIATSSDEIMRELRDTVDDDAFASDIEGLIAIPEIIFFAFDTNITDSVRFMYVGSEPLDSDMSLTMDDYLNKMMDNFKDSNDRIVERQIAQLDNFPAGKLVIESKVPAGDVEKFVSMAIYMIEVEDTMWFIAFRTGRSEFAAHQETILTAVNSFWVQR